MDVNPHSLNVILNRIREQVRCPQCGTKVPIDFPAVKVAQENVMLLQLKCDSCGAFIVLQVNVTEQGLELVDMPKRDHLLNVSSSVSLTESEMHTLHGALEKYEGSFEKMFKDIGGTK